jgi:carbon monoxide dehydrogenase subunit G
MARYNATVNAPHSAEEVWRYLADLRSVAEWDPSVISARLVGGEPRTVSARYELEVNFLSGAVTIPYRTIEAELPHRVVFAADTRLVSVRDEALIEPAGAGASDVTWDADLRLKGIRKVLDLPVRAAFNRIGQRAEKGLVERLSEPSLDVPTERVRA